MTDCARAASIARLPAALEAAPLASFFPGANPGVFVFPGFCDCHVHLREPGFCYKEDIASGTAAAARGGFTAVCAMPNLDPVPDCLDNLRPELAAIDERAAVRVAPFGAISRGERGEELSDMAALAPYVIGFSDDGRGVEDEGLLRAAMEWARELGKPIAAHCEFASLAQNGVVNERVASEWGLPPNPPQSEWRMVERDLRLADETGAAYHVCHVSTKESVSLIREAKKSGVNVTFETAPHYLLLDDESLRDDGAYRMNPPLRSRSDREALLEAAADGTLDAIATDHAPHSAAEKAGGLAHSLFGVVGMETAFPALHKGLVEEGVLPLARLLELLSSRPRSRFDLPTGDDVTVWDLSDEYLLDPADFSGKGRSTPFAGMRVRARPLATRARGRWVYLDEPRLAAAMG